MSEQAARTTLHAHVKKYLPKDTHWQRFEDRYHAGIPDINIALPGGREWWVEAKHIDRLPAWKNTPVRVDLRREQTLWLKKRKKVGGNCLVLVRLGAKEWVAFDDHFERLEEGLPIETFFQLSRWRGRNLDVTAFLMPGSDLDPGNRGPS